MPAPRAAPGTVRQMFATTTSSDVFETPRRLQRLTSPALATLTSPHPLSDDLAPLGDVVGFEHMGPVDYPRDEIADAFTHLARALTSGAAETWSFEPLLRARSSEGLDAPRASVELYVLAPAGLREPIERAYTELANEPRRDFTHLEAPSVLAYTLRPRTSRSLTPTLAWLDLTNRCLVARDRNFFDALVAALETRVTAPTAPSTNHEGES